MSSKRTSLGLDDESIDLEDLTGEIPYKSHTITPEIKKALDEEGAKHGFVSREPVLKKTRKRSPYIIQKNIKMRIGMPELLNDLTVSIGSGSDQETLEIAIKSLIDQKGLTNLKEKYMDIKK